MSSTGHSRAGRVPSPSPMLFHSQGLGLGLADRMSLRGNRSILRCNQVKSIEEAPHHTTHPNTTHSATYPRLHSPTRSRSNRRMPVTYLPRPGPSGADCAATGFSNAVIIPATATLVITAGQAGIDLATGELVSTSPQAQIEAAFDCVDAALRSAGVAKGLAGAHKINSYLTDPRHDGLMMEIWRRRCPGHRPVWASVGSHVLVLPGMIVELQAEAVVLPGEGKL